VRCECCGWEGEDDVAQWVIEEAVMERLRVQSETVVEELRDVSPGDQQKLDHAARMARLTGDRS